MTTVGNNRRVGVKVAHAAGVVAVVPAAVVVELDDMESVVVTSLEDRREGFGRDGIFAGGLVGVYNLGNTGSGRQEEENVEDGFPLAVVVALTLGMR